MIKDGFCCDVTPLYERCAVVDIIAFLSKSQVIEAREHKQIVQEIETALLELWQLLCTFESSHCTLG